MCFHIENNPNEIIAKRDIVVYKTLEREGPKSYLSVHQGTRYEIERNKTFHAMEKSFLKLRRTKVTKLVVQGDSIYAGLHSFKYLDSAKRSCGSATDVIRFVIPKGTPYYENHSERVSLQLRYVKTVIRGNVYWNEINKLKNKI